MPIWLLVLMSRVHGDVKEVQASISPSHCSPPRMTKQYLVRNAQGSIPLELPGWSS